MSNALKVRRPDLVMPAYAATQTPKRGMELVNLRSLGILPGIAGGARGIHAEGDIVRETVDGVDLNRLWDDYQEQLGLYNEERSRLVQFLTWPVTAPSEPYAVGGEQAEFEESTEYGEPVGYRPAAQQAFLGYTLKWFDLAGRFTWRFLANAPANQVDAFANMATEADNRLVFQQVMKTLFNNSRRVNEFGTTVYPFYSGEAGDQPPTYRSTSFADNHNHYVTSGEATVNAESVEDLFQLLAEHGYVRQNGYEPILMVNKAEGDAMRNWRSLANGGVSPATGGGLYDFIPAQGTPTFLLPEQLRVTNQAAQPANSIRGMTVIGSYGEFTVVQEDYIPAGYMVAFVTGGAESIQNPIGFREHTNASLRGLRLVKGRQPDYPLVDSFYNHGFGTGVKWRGAGAIMQVTTNGTYAVPTEYEW